MKKLIITALLCLLSLTDYSQTSKLDSFLNVWIGVPYRYGGTTLNGIDCSGFVQKMYEDVFDVLIPRTAKTQYKAATKIPKDEISLGDLLFFMSDASPSGWHVAVYLGNNLYAHAANRRTGVVMSELTASVRKRIYAVGRFDDPKFDLYFYLKNLKS
jgi:cell wall-associated NlpC family hydrolase